MIMLQLQPARNIKPNLAKITGCLISLPITLVLFGVYIWIVVALNLPNIPILGVFVMLASAAGGVFIKRVIQDFLSAWWRKLTLYKLAEPTLTITQDTVTVGDSFTLIYRQPVRRAINITQFSVQLLHRTRTIQERKVYGFGDSVERRRDRVIQTMTRDGQHYEPGEIIEWSLKLTIPAGEKGTSQTLTQHTDWLMKVQVRLAGWWDFQEEYPVPVLPPDSGFVWDLWVRPKTVSRT
ncbi:MAG TPA: hypothetical protein VLG46_05075 [Anaerolineae bacterium]|nr:hypothetical protein [Anaerolineae bacterium]